MDRDSVDDEHQSSLDALDNMDSSNSIHDSSSSSEAPMQYGSDASKPNQQMNLMEESEEEDEIVDVEEVEDEEGFLHIDTENLDHEGNENEEDHEQDNNNSAQYSDHEQDEENEGEQSESEDESDSESNEDLSEEEHFNDHENGGFTIDNTERQYMFDINPADAQINHLRDSMQQATQYDDNFDMHMNHYLDPHNIMPGFEVVQLPTSLPTPTVPSTETSLSAEPDKAQEDKPRRGRVAKSKLLAQAESVFKDNLKNLTSERDILNFLRFVDQFFSSTYGISIFEVRRPVKKVTTTTTSASTSAGPSEAGLVPRRKFPKRALSITTILQSPESPLVRLNLREIINYKTFNLLDPKEKDSLLQFLPDVDKTSKEAVEHMFNSHAFLSSLPTFQEMLSMGEFENNKDEYLQYVKGKKKRETTDAWKEKYYEEYWGQKSKNKEHVVQEHLPTFSFVEHAKEHTAEDLEAAFPTHTFIKNVEESELVQLEDAAPQPTTAGRRGRKKKAKDSDDEEEEPPRPKPTVKKETENDNFVAEEEEEDEEGKPRKRKREKKNDKDYAPGAPVGKVKRERSSSGNSFRHCAYEILLREQRPLSAAEIIKIALKEGLITTTGKTPQNTLASVIYCEMKKDPNCSFTKVGPMTFGLKEFKYKDTNVLDDEGKPKKRRKKKGAS